MSELMSCYIARFIECCKAHQSVKALNGQAYCSESDLEVYKKATEFWDWMALLLRFLFVVGGTTGVVLGLLSLQSEFSLTGRSSWGMVLVSFSLGFLISGVLDLRKTLRVLAGIIAQEYR